MKTSKGKAPAKPKKTPEAGSPSKIRSVRKMKSEPSEDEIRAKAQEIYYERISRGESGTPEGDWHVAEELIRGAKQ